MALLVAVAILGLPPLLVLVKGPHDGSPARQQRPDSLQDLAARQSALAVAYQEWERSYVRSGGDRNVVIALVQGREHSNAQNTARGWVKLDLVGGAVSAEVNGLAAPSDLWLVDSDPGLLPDADDRMVRVGRLEASGKVSRLSADLSREFFPDFELDVVFVTPAGKTPLQEYTLLGTRSFFERTFTKARLTDERSGRSSLVSVLSKLLGPAPAEADSTQILIAHGLVSAAVGRGADLFFRGTFSGNGRTCGTCHPAQNNQVVEAAFIQTLPPNDPIFVAEFPPASGGVPGLERPRLMREFGLILENVDGFENPTVKFTMRGVPHTLSQFTSIARPPDGNAPVQRTGWSGDGAPRTGALRLFAEGAVTQHFTKSLKRVVGVDFRLPTNTELDNMEAFLLSSGRLNELILTQVRLTNAGADLGRRIFNNSRDLTIGQGQCFLCHSNAGANASFDGTNFTNFNFDTGVDQVPHPARQVENFPFDGGLGRAPADCNEDGVQESLGDCTFNTPPLVEAADTGPFFHNNVITTMENAVGFYMSPQFQASPSGGIGVNISPQDINNVAAFLRVINAAFNADISIQRNNAAIALENSRPVDDGTCASLTDPAEVEALCSGGGDNGKRATVNALLLLSNAEAQDAIDVLTARSLHADAVSLFRSAINKNTQARNTNASQERKDLMLAALNDLKAAKARFGSGLNFTMGEGNLLF